MDGRQWESDMGERWERDCREGRGAARAGSGDRKRGRVRHRLEHDTIWECFEMPTERAGEMRSVAREGEKAGSRYRIKAKGSDTEGRRTKLAAGGHWLRFESRLLTTLPARWLLPSSFSHSGFLVKT